MSKYILITVVDKIPHHNVSPNIGDQGKSKRGVSANYRVYLVKKTITFTGFYAFCKETKRSLYNDEGWGNLLE